MSVLNNEVLVLNKSWIPLIVIPLKKAIKLLTKYEEDQPKAKVLDVLNDYQVYSWEDWAELPINNGLVIKGVNRDYRVPEVIVLTHFNETLSKRLRFTKRGILRRDKKCAYCGFRSNLTIDHIVPRGKGGETSWLNCVAACTLCNSFKGGRTPEQAGMQLLFQPKKPQYSFCIEAKYDSWQLLLGKDENN